MDEVPLYVLRSKRNKGTLCGSFLRQGEVIAYGGFVQNLKDLKESTLQLDLGSNPDSCACFCYDTGVLRLRENAPPPRTPIGP